MLEEHFSNVDIVKCWASSRMETQNGDVASQKTYPCGKNVNRGTWISENIPA
jgi:hypothetical protein